MYLADLDGGRIIALNADGSQRSAWPTINGSLPYSPWSVAVDSSNNVYVTVQQVNNRSVVGVMVMSSAGLVKALYLAPRRRFSTAVPDGVAVSSTHIYLANSGDSSIDVLDMTGQWVKSFNSSSLVDTSVVALDSNGALWVGNMNRPAINRPAKLLLKLDASTGEVLASVNWTASTSYGEVRRNMAFDHDNNLYFIAMINNLDGQLCILHSDGRQSTISPPPSLSLNTITYDSFNDRLLATSYDALYIFDKSGSFVQTIVGSFYPTSLAIDSSQAVYVATKLSSLSAPIFILSRDRSIRFVSPLQPNSIAVDASGLTPFIYATANGGAGTYNAVTVLWPNGTLYSTYTLGSRNNHAMQWLTMGPSGLIYVVDRGQRAAPGFSYFPPSVWVLNNNGSIAAHYENASFVNPSAVAADASGLMYVTDLSNSSVVILNPNGSLRFIFPVPSPPTGIAVNPAGTQIHVAVPALNATHIYSSNGTLQCVIKAGFSGPSAVALDSTGLLYVGDTMNQRVVVLDVSGSSCNAASGGGEMGGLYRYLASAMMLMAITALMSV